jgi:putative transcriptional regulator
MLRPWLAAALFVLTCVLLVGSKTNAQSGSERLSPGTLLIASDKLVDPNFSETVVFIIRRDADAGALGVVLNRPMDLTLAKAFPSMHATADPVYDGGPVSPDAVQALLRTTTKTADAEHIAGDIYAVVHKALLEKSITARLPSEKFRVYLGYAGWGPGQLENEIQQGAWSTMHTAKYVFDSDPASLWQRLKRDSESQIAQTRSPRLLLPSELTITWGRF